MWSGTKPLARRPIMHFSRGQSLQLVCLLEQIIKPETTHKETWLLASVVLTRAEYYCRTRWTDEAGDVNRPYNTRIKPNTLNTPGQDRSDQLLLE